MTTAATQSRTLTFDSQLIEDFLQTVQISVNPTVSQPMAVFENLNGQSEALVIGRNFHGNNELYHVYREPLSDSGWNVYGIGACAAALAVENSTTAWVLGTDGQCWRNQAGRWRQNVPTVPGGTPASDPDRGYTFTPLSVGLDGTVWAIDGGGIAYRFDGKSWQPAAGVPRLSQAPVGRPGNLWALGARNSDFAYPICYDNGSGWQSVSWPGATALQVAVGTDDSVWAIGLNGGLYRYAHGTWNQVSGAPSLKTIAVGSAENIWATMTDGPLYQLIHYDGKSWTSVSQVPASSSSVRADVTPQLSIAADGSAWFVDFNGVAWRYVSAASGWQRQMAPTGMSGRTAGGGVTEVAAGSDSSGPKMLFIQNGSYCVGILTKGGTWYFAVPMGSGCTAAGATNQGDALLLYWAGGEGSLNVVTYQAGNYAHKSYPTYQEYQSPKGILAGAKQIQINAQNSESWFIAAVLGDGLYAQMGTSSNPFQYGSSLTPGMLYAVARHDGTSVPIKGLVGLPWVVNPWYGFYCAVLDDKSNIQLVTGIAFSVNAPEFNADYSPLTGPNSRISSPVAAVQSTGGVIDLGGNGRIYATDSNGTLWVIRQTSNPGTNIGPWNWTNWHPLANGVLQMANGPGAHNTHELFTIDSLTFLSRLWQDTTTLNWNSAELHKPQGEKSDPVYVSLYETEITVFNQDGVPDPNVKVTVTVNEPVSVWVTGKQYDLEPGRPAVLVTDAFGKISITTPALSLHTAQLTFQADGFDRPYAVYPPRHAQDKLKNVDGAALQHAQARKASLPTPVYTDLTSSSDKTCHDTATAIRDALQIQTTNKIQPGLPTGASPDGSPLTYDQVRALWAAKGNGFEIVSIATGAPGSWDSFWADLENFFEDVWYGIRSGILTVEKVVLEDIATGLIDVWVTLKSAGTAALKFFIKTIDDVAHFVEAAFQWIGAAIEDAIDWLKEFFDWDDILNTHKVTRHLIDGALENLQKNLDPNSPASAQLLVRAQFQKVVELFSGSANQSDIFTRARTAFGRQSFNDVVSKMPVNPQVGPSVLHPDGVKKTHAANQVKSGYARRKTDTYSRQGGKLTPAHFGAAAESNPLDQFLSAANKVRNNPGFQNGQANLKSNLHSLGANKDFFDTALNDFLAAVKDILTAMIDLAEDLIVALLDAAGGAVTTFRDILDYQLDIPILSWIYFELTGSSLTLLDLMCLILAIPATLIYKLIWGGEKASPPFDDQLTTQLTQTAFPWPQLHNGQVGMLPPTAAPGSPIGKAADIILNSVALINCIFIAFVEAGTDLTVAVDIDSGEGGTWWSVFAILSSLQVFVATTPVSVLQKSPDQRTLCDNMYLAAWGAGSAGILLNFLTLIGSKQHKLAKYIPTVGVILVTVVGIAQEILGVIAAVLFAILGEGYNAAYSVGSIITPIPSAFKFQILTEDPFFVTFELILDVVCDIGSGACTLAEAITSPGADAATA